jgi:hypothetical protein
VSDYIYSSKTQADEFLAGALNGIYVRTSPTTTEYRGPWGTLVVTQGHYHGFRPYENDQHLMVVTGGPVLYFRDNDFLVAEDSSAATEAIYNRWVVEGSIQWDEDLSGPFTILLIDKQAQAVTVITDLMAFIPVYSCQKAGELYLGTHVDALANATGEQELFDQVSLADFILNDVVTYPYTAYENLRQLAPSSAIVFSTGLSKSNVTRYWIPEEENPYTTVQQAAEALREGIFGYVACVTQKMTKVAQFISAGEDSRSLSGMLPERLQRDAFVFLDSMNREGRIAKRVAEIYGVNFNVGYRSATHYLEILPEATKLVGSGYQYIHAHSLGFDKTYKLADYSAVFGGYTSDALVKAAYTRKLRGIGRFPFVPEFYLKGEVQIKPITSPLIEKAVLADVNRRRIDRFKAVKAERPITAHEWFVLHPATMLAAIPNLYTNRRLFRSYEPFMCKEAVKISASVPTTWKLNRRLFNRAMKPYLRKSKWLLHADGRLPYFSWWANMPLQFGVWFYRHVAKRTGLIKGNQGPWGDWKATSQSSAWQKVTDKCAKHGDGLAILKGGKSAQELLNSNLMPISRRVNLLQVAYQVGEGAADNKR